MKHPKLFKILILVFSFCFTTGIGSTMAAGLVVQFEKTPLFEEANFIPGGTVTRFIKVTNTSGEEKKAIIEAVNKKDPSGFSGKLNLEIKHGSSVIFSDTLTKFFAAGEVDLSKISNGLTEQYDLKMSLSPDTDNSFKNATVGFDLLVGFEGEGTTDNPHETVNANIYSVGGGGGGAAIPPGLTISGEGSRQVNEVNEVEITWQTNYASTSSVIYDTKPNTFDFSKGEPSFGYAYYKSGDASGVEKVISHKIILTGLVLGQTYYYRVVSHASPATIGREYSFVMDRSKIKIEQELNNEPQSTGIVGTTGGSATVEQLGQSGSGSQDLTNQENSEETPEDTSAMASLASFLPDFLKRFNLPPWFSDNILLILAIIIAILGYIVWRKGKKEGPSGTYLVKYAYFLWAFSAVLFILYFWSFWE
ncbi:MAG: fibronectin type III domain-containing protein [Candidatus Paceibacterota bacterium]|jgi:hypothetical protein